jgi:glycerate dehydrogenase
MRIAVLDAFTTDQGDAATWDGLRALGTAEIHPRTAPGALVARARGCPAVLTNKAPLDAAALAALAADGLRYVGVMATGTNVVDLAAAKRLGIAVSNVPGYSTESVAQLVFALLLQLTTDVAGHSAAAKAGAWASCPDFCFFRQPVRELAGQTLAIIGMGAIGRSVARLAAAFGMRVLAAQAPGSTSPGRVPLAEALAAADVVSLHCPLTPATDRLVGERFLAALRPGAIVINTGRGGLIDEAAVIAALASGRLGGLALDVLTREPPPAGHPLLDPAAPWAARVVITPHIAWGTVEARRRLALEVVANLAAFQRGEERNRVA